MVSEYNRFVKKRMAGAIKSEGSAKAAMRKIGKEWRNRK